MRLLITLEEKSYAVEVEVLPDVSDQADEDRGLEIPDSVLLPPLLPDTRDVDKICRSPIAGAIVSVEVRVGMRVHKEDPVAIIDAMKMETMVGAPVDGIVEEISVTKGDAVKPGQVICRLS
ncbi:MAG TPA: acetyl-CoA carboxylase biotin carboxyl carrier protein subunit [Bryobacteraceae bacterium]|jgi:biotin carboxyl carrier protein